MSMQAICIRPGPWKSITAPGSECAGPRLNEIVTPVDSKLIKFIRYIRLKEYLFCPYTGKPSWYKQCDFAPIMTSEELAFELSGLNIELTQPK